MTKRVQWQSFVIALALCASGLLAACGLLGGQTGQESKSADEAPDCTADRTAIADSDDRAIGASPRDVADALRGPLRAPMTWTLLQTTTHVNVAIDYAGHAAQFDTREDDCTHQLSLDVTLTIKTDDGLLDEHVPATLIASAPDSATLDVTIAIADLNGSYDAAEVEGASSDSELQISVQWLAGTTHGSLDVLSTHAFGDGTAGKSTDQVGSW
jgi:hypothetical protein